VTRSDTDGDEREQGVDFGPLADELADETYPMEGTALVAAYGDYTLDVEGAETTLREILGPQGDVTYDSPADVRRGVLSMVGAEAVGREGYSDRGGGREPERTDESV
jgi:hypothetical protein